MRLRYGILAAFLATYSVGCEPAPQTAAPPAKVAAVTETSKQAPIEEPNRVPAPGGAPQAGGKWVTVKGQVVLSAAAVAAMGAPKPVNVTANQDHCLSKGPIMPEDVILNKTNRGLQNVVVWLRPANKERDAKLPADAIHPDLAKDKVKSKNLVVDQPCCMFVPRITLAREGDTVEFKNSSPINHNTKWASSENGEFNVNIAPSQSHKVTPLKYERTQIPFECSSHPWMKGQVRVFDHPYFALTDADGKFEIKNAPAGNYHIVYAHENGFHKGAEGRFGWPITIQAGANGTMELKPVEYEFPKN